MTTSGFRGGLRARRLGVTGALGLFASALAAGVSLHPTRAVTPRVFSPNGDGINDLAYISVVNPGLAELTGRVYDLTGGDVAVLASAGWDPDEDDVFRLVWDGRDNGGRVVPSGVYVFVVRGGGISLTGIVAVAR